MAADLYGNVYVDNWEYARKIVTKGVTMPFFKVLSYKTTRGLAMELVQEDFFDEHIETNAGGLYAIYEKRDNNLTCLYTGSTRRSMRTRVYRFVKELHDVSHKDENHPAAKKARRAGIDPAHIFVKFFPRNYFPVVNNNLIVDLDTLDETCAILLKSRFNKIRKS